jgi:hypothetical protein
VPGQYLLGVDQEAVSPIVHKGGKGRIDLAISAGEDDLNLSPGRSRRPQVSDHGLKPRKSGTDKQGKARRCRHQLTQEFEPLGCEFRVHGGDTGDVAARSIEAGD